jgi:TolA-binding protein
VRYKLGLIIFLSFFLQACAHRNLKSGKNKHVRTVEVADQRNRTLHTVNSRELASNKNSLGDQILLSTLDEAAAKNWAIPESDQLYFELSGEKYENLNSQQVYEKIIEKYRSNDLKAVEAYTNLLLAKYPQSHFADNALYLQGMLAFSVKTYAKSLECFQKIINLYPNGNKVVAALFAKGILYKKMNLKTESENVLSNIKIKYPGSPESLRADAEIKILKQ